MMGEATSSSVIATRPGESAPTRFFSSSLWSLGNLIGVEKAHLAFHRLQARQKGAEEIYSTISVLPSPTSEGAAAARSFSRIRFQSKNSSTAPSTVFLREYAAFVGLRNILLGAGWARVVKIPSPFVSTAGGSLASVLSAKNAEARLRSYQHDSELGPFVLASEFLWVQHPESRLWRDVKDALSNLRHTVQTILADQSVWASEQSASAALNDFVSSFNSAVRTLNEGVDSFRGLLPDDPLLQGAEAAIVESVRGPVQGLPDTMDEAEEAGLRFNREGTVSLTGLQLSVSVPQTDNSPGMIRSRLVARALEKIGVTLSTDYTLQFDKEVFSAAFDREMDTIRDLFAAAPRRGEYDDGLPILRRLGTVLDTLLQAESGSFRLTEEQAERLRESRPWEAYMKAAADLRRQSLSLLV